MARGKKHTQSGSSGEWHEPSVEMLNLSRNRSGYWSPIITISARVYVSSIFPRILKSGILQTEDSPFCCDSEFADMGDPGHCMKPGMSTTLQLSGECRVGE